ncbi:MAG: hypothetical protein ISP91_12770 [Pseudomonadales bacterium]|nr:hypothetical protein [Pseudomonadales bacterium]
MVHCQICNKPIQSVVYNYRQECRSCRDARKQLKKDGVSLREIKNYLKATGLQPDQVAARVMAEVEVEDGKVVKFRSKKNGDN